MSDLNLDEECISFAPVILYMNYINIQHKKHLNKLFKNISPTDFVYISTIFYKPNISQKELAEILYVSESNVTQMVNKLEKKELIARTPDSSNKSRKILYLTDKGKDILLSFLKIVYEWEGKFFEKYSKEDVLKFRKMVIEYSDETVTYK